MSKIITATFVYNDFEYLHETLESIKDFGDKHYIIEGAWESTYKNGVDKRSNKITYDIINRHLEKDKVILIQANEKNQAAQRDVGFNIAKEENADWFFMTDADEVWPKNSLKFVRKILDGNANNERAYGYRVKSFNFINSFKKYYRGDYWRIYKPTENSIFFGDNDVLYLGDGYISNIGPVNYYHYNYVKPKNSELFWLKMKWQQDPDFWKNNIETEKYGFDGKNYKIPSDIKIYDFPGKHPLIMKSHPYFADNFYNDDNLEFLDQ